MNYFFDCEFYEDGKIIDLISIGMVDEYGQTFYAISTEFDAVRAATNPWLVENVLSKLPARTEHDLIYMSREQIRDGILAFVEDDMHPKFWSYFADYDWICVCQLFGKMIDLPDHFPQFCLDMKQLQDELGVKRSELPKSNPALQHDALEDALWHKRVHDFLQTRKKTGEYRA